MTADDLVPEAIELIDKVCRRPMMYHGFTESSSPSELVAYLSGICTGVKPPLGADTLGDFPDFVRSRSSADRNQSVFDTLSEAMSQMDFFAACDHVHGLIEKWRADRDTPAGADGPRR